MVGTRLVLPSPAPAPRQRILLLHTGGTLGGSFSDDLSLEADRAAVAQEFVQDLQSHCAELFELADITIRVLFQADSSNMGVGEWAVLAQTMVDAWGEFDAFVIIHGTDTLAYCSSYLALTMVSPSKPIVVTGSQRPLRELRSDARMNLIDAVQLASLGLPGVFVAFDSNVYLGSRVAKTSNLELGAFQSPNFPAVGHFGVEIELNTAVVPAATTWHTRGSPSGQTPGFDGRAEPALTQVGVVPGAGCPAPLRQSLLACSKGLVIEGFGLGHAPTRVSDWMDLCDEAYRQNIPVLMVSPCRRGRIDMGLYPVGKAFLERGVVSAGDMTRECAIIKLMLFLGRRLPFASRHEFMANPLERETSGGVPAGARA